VRDELEILARNQAAEIPADTIKASSEPKDGAQTYLAYVCGTARVHQRDAADHRPAPASQNNGDVQTFPVKDH